MIAPIDQSADILLVEDNRGDARLAEEAFKDAQLSNTLHIVTDGKEALDFVYQRGEHTDAPRPSVIFLDWNLPKASGKEVLSEIKSDPSVGEIHVIVLLGSRAEEDIIKPNSYRPNAFIAKPVESADFVTAARSVDG